MIILLEGSFGRVVVARSFGTYIFNIFRLTQILLLLYKDSLCYIADCACKYLDEKVDGALSFQVSTQP